MAHSRTVEPRVIRVINVPTGKRARPALVVGLLVLLVTACVPKRDVIVRENDEPEPSEEAGVVPDPGEDFRCLGTRWLEEAEDDEIEIIARLVDITDGAPVHGMRVTRCSSRLNIECTGGTEHLSDENGLVRVQVPKPFNGYLRVEGPDTNGTEWVGYLWYFSQPLRNTYVFGSILAMTPEFRDGVIYGAALGSGITRDPERGEIAIIVTDCSPQDPPTQTIDGKEILNAPGIPAPNVHFEITTEQAEDDSLRHFYFSNGQPSWPTRRSEQHTDASGLGGFLNVPPGPFGIRALPESIEGPSAEDTVLVRAGFLTTASFPPR